MISPPICQNKKCTQFDKFEKDSIKKVVSKKNTYICKICLQEFKWSMPTSRGKNKIIY